VDADARVRNHRLDCLRYTDKTVKRVLSLFLIAFTVVPLCFANDVSFRRVKVADSNGKQVNAMLTLSDQDKAVEIRPAKGNNVIIPYSQIDKCSYEYTKKHRINEATIASAPVGIGAAIMLTKGKVHWLEIDYHDQDRRRVAVLHMDKHNYLRILDALKSHVGIDAEILGNADKR